MSGLTFFRKFILLSCVAATSLLSSCKTISTNGNSSVKDEGNLYYISSLHDSQGPFISIFRGQNDLGKVPCDSLFYPGNGTGLICKNNDFQFTRNPNRLKTNLLKILSSNGLVYMECTDDNEKFSCSQSSIGPLFAADPSMPHARLQMALTGILSVAFLDPMNGFAVVDTAACRQSQGLDVKSTICGGSGLFSFSRNSGASIITTSTITNLSNGRTGQAVCDEKKYYIGDVKVISECIAKAP